MAGGGVVCQDCHGDMLAVGDDFTKDFPTEPWAPEDPDYVGNLDKRVPWAVPSLAQMVVSGGSASEESWSVK